MYTMVFHCIQYIYVYVSVELYIYIYIYIFIYIYNIYIYIGRNTSQTKICMVYYSIPYIEVYLFFIQKLNPE